MPVYQTEAFGIKNNNIDRHSRISAGYKLRVNTGIKPEREVLHRKYLFDYIYVYIHS